MRSSTPSTRNSRGATRIRTLQRAVDGRAKGDLRIYQDQAHAQSEQLIEAQRALAEACDRFMGMYHAAPVAFATLDRNGIVEEINQTGLALLHLDREQVLHRPLLVFVVKDDRQLFLNHMYRCRKSDRPCMTELHLSVRGAAPALVQLTSRPAMRERIGGMCYLTAITDLTEVRTAQAEQQRLALQAQAARAASDAKDHFLAVLSHELRTPLAPVLGLAISKAITEMHGGSLSACSEGLGKGSTFTFRLPLLPASTALPAAPASSVSAGAPPRPLRILLVEDHGDTARIMKKLLSADGHSVEIAGDVATAMDLAREQSFDLMLSDLGLPDGSGLDLMRAIRAQGLKLPSIALSGYGQETDVQQSREAGFTAHLVKPVNIPKLKEAIAHAAQSNP